jgi:endonuclease/exonuclease/phosphatase family metal-dependent hydrolase
MRALLFGLLVVGVCLAGEGLSRADPAPAVRVMSFNVRYGTAKDGEDHWDKRKEMLAGVVRAYRPDLLGTQETLAFQREFLTKELTGYGAWGAGRDDGKENGEMAALFWREARFEKVGGGHFWLSETPDKAGSKGWDAALPRVVSWVRLKDRHDPSAKPVLFLNTHFDHRGRKARAEAARLVRERVSKLSDGSSVIVTGDFNAAEGSEPYLAMFGKEAEKASPLVDTYRVKHPARGKEEGTFNGFKAGTTVGSRIDWVGCSRDWKVEGAGIDRTTKGGRTPSDHFPVTAELRR